MTKLQQDIKPSLLGVIVVVIGLIAGCSQEARHKILTVVFDDVPALGQEQPAAPYIKQPRRLPPYKPPPPEMTRLKKNKPAFKYDWKALLLALPKDTVGGIDWSTALATAAIKPLDGIDSQHTKEQPVLPLDVQLEPNGLPMFKATFPHKPHTEWLACDNCHQEIFQMRAGADPITMEKIFAGQYCGKCHGKVAFAVTTGCPRCHLAMAAAQ